MDTPPQTQRLDKWLHYARVVKTRALARELAEKGGVSVNGAIVKKAGATVRVGDVLVITLLRVRRTLTVKAPGERRGPATEAALLFAEPDPPERLGGFDTGPVLTRDPGAGRPTKKDRRALDKLRDV